MGEVTRLGTTLLHTIKSRTEPVFALRPRGAKVFFPAVLQRAAGALKKGDVEGTPPG